MGLDKKGYYTETDIVSDDIMYYWIYSGRGVGKSTALWKRAITEAIESNSMALGYIRRRVEDIKDGEGVVSAVNGSNYMREWLSDLTGGEWTELTTYRRRIYLCRYDEEKDKYIKGLCIGQMFALSEYERYKSRQYDTITTCIFEEVMTDGLYIYNEPMQLMNLISTMVRDRTNMKVFMLSNTISRYSPYMEEWCLVNIVNQEPGTVNDYHVLSYNSYGEEVKQTIRVEYAKSKAENKAASIFLGKSSKSILTGEWETKEYNHIAYNDYESLYQLSLVHSPFVFNIELLFHKTNNTKVVFIHPGKKIYKRKIRLGLYDDIYTTSYLKSSITAETLIKELLDDNQVAFSSNLCGEDFYQVLNNNKDLLTFK